MGNELILTANGLNTSVGRKVINRALAGRNLVNKKIFLISVPEYRIEELLVDACVQLGFLRENIILSGEGRLNEDVDYVYVSEGNTFVILDYIRKHGLVAYIQEWVRNGTVYIGASAGAMIAGDEIRLAEDFDSNTVGMRNYDALKLFDGAIIPHYSPADLKRYVAASDRQLIKRYKKIYSVDNGEALIFNPIKKCIQRIKVK